MREHLKKQQKRIKAKELDSSTGRTSRYCVPTIYRGNKLDTPTHIFEYDGSAWIGGNYISDKEFAHSLALITISAGIFGLGIGKLISELMGG